MNLKLWNSKFGLQSQNFLWPVVGGAFHISAFVSEKNLVVYVIVTYRYNANLILFYRLLVLGIVKLQAFPLVEQW